MYHVIKPAIALSPVLTPRFFATIALHDRAIDNATATTLELLNFSSNNKTVWKVAGQRTPNNGPPVY